MEILKEKISLRHIRQVNLTYTENPSERIYACIENAQRDSWRILVIRQETQTKHTVDR
jgi:hypothetical protein